MTHDSDRPMFHAPLLPSGPIVVAQLGQSLDGRIALSNGESRYINGMAALNHLHGLRAEVDAVIVGVGTLVADDPRLTVRRRPGASPARVVIDPSGRAPPGALLFSQDGTRVLHVRKSGRAPRADLPAHVEDVSIEAADGRLPPRAIVAALRAAGLSRLLVEGGADTVSAFIDAGAVDRLHLLVAPMILGSGRNGLAMAPIASLASARRPATRIEVLADGDVLFDCDLRAAAREETP